MRFRMGLTVGFAAGYVLGAKAGRQRYEQIRQTTEKIWDSQQAEKLRHEIKEKLPDTVNAAAHKIGEIRRNGGDGPGPVTPGDTTDLVRAGRLPA